MTTIYKYQIEITDKQHVQIQGFNGFLKVAEQNGNLYLWCIVNKEAEFIHTAEITIIGTGNPISHNTIANEATHFDSVLMSNGLVWHVFIT